MAEKEQQIRADGQAGILANDRLKINRATLLGVGLIVVAGVATWLGHTAIALPLGLVGTVAALSSNNGLARPTPIEAPSFST